MKMDEVIKAKIVKEKETEKIFPASECSKDLFESLQLYCHNVNKPLNLLDYKLKVQIFYA